MRSRLGLSGGELVAYALVHQFSQSNAGRYTGGPGYIAGWLGCGENTARTYLHSLVKKGLVKCIEREEGGIKYRDYIVISTPSKNRSTPSKNNFYPLQKLEADNNTDNKKNIHTSSNEEVCIKKETMRRFDFRGALLSAGVDIDVAEGWLQVRKEKRAVNTRIAWEAIEKELGKASGSPTDCIRLAVEHSWAGFRADWYERAIASKQGAAAKGDSSFDKIIAQGKRLGIISEEGGSCDEQ